MIALRDRPAPLAPWRIRPCTFVAMTTCSRVVSLAIARPRTSSLDPFEYTLAVSKKLTPAARARSKNGRLASSSSDHGCAPRPGSP
jgi:hypothetical protein